MELTFLGRGSAFNPKEGNTSAYFIENNQLFLIDCGESVFERIIEFNILDSIDEINLMITHTHSDHIGSIGSLVMYSFYTLHKPLNIILPSDPKYITNIEGILNGFGCTPDMYNYLPETYFDNKCEEFYNIRYTLTTHYSNLNCYSLLFNTPNGIVYYSGDTNKIDAVTALIDSGVRIDKLYIDTTTDDYPGNVHLNIILLSDSIPPEFRKSVYCMHLNSDECIEKAYELGFNVVLVDNHYRNHLNR